MSDPLWLADVLRAEGLKVIEHEGWQFRGHGDFGDIKGVICHHTAGGGPRDWEVVQFGRADLPGPLAQLVLERDGTYRLVAVGVCWHAGRGSFSDWPANNANFHTIGIEAVNNGCGQEWPERQLDAYKRGVAAILRRIGRDADDCAGHKEYSSEGKIDPFPLDMAAFRADVQRFIDGGSPEGDDAMSIRFINDAGHEVDAATALYFIDKHVGLILDQLGGPGAKNGTGFPGWDLLGGDTVVEAIAKLRKDVDDLKQATAARSAMDS